MTKLTDNNQSEYARERASESNWQHKPDDNLTTNTSQPNREITPNNPPPPGHTPQNATTGCTTLLPPSQGIPENPTPLHQSDMTIFPNCPQRMEKDPPATPSPSFGGQNAMSTEGPPPTTLPDYQGPHVHIVHDQAACYVYLTDNENEDFAPGVWQILTDDPQVFSLSVPDWRYLQTQLVELTRRNETLVGSEQGWIQQIDALRAELLAMTAQNQQTQEHNLRLLSNIDGDNQRIRELRDVNLTLVNKRIASANENARVSRENHELRKSLREATDAMTVGIARLQEMHQAAERIKEILK